jgi:hypothetical protein
MDLGCVWNNRALASVLLSHSAAVTIALHL